MIILDHKSSDLRAEIYNGVDWIHSKLAVNKSSAIVLCSTYHVCRQVAEAFVEKHSYLHPSSGQRISWPNGSYVHIVPITNTDLVRGMLFDHYWLHGCKAETWALLTSLIPFATDENTSGIITRVEVPTP